MDIKEAAYQTQKLLVSSLSLPDNNNEYGSNHIQYMLDKISNGEIKDEKAHRWLGWAQCAICIGGGASLDALTEINKKS